MPGISSSPPKEETRIIVTIERNVESILCPKSAIKEERLYLSPLKNGVYKGKKIYISLYERKIPWIVVYDHNEKRLKGKAVKAWDIDAKNKFVSIRKMGQRRSS